MLEIFVEEHRGRRAGAARRDQRIAHGRKQNLRQIFFALQVVIVFALDSADANPFVFDGIIFNVRSVGSHATIAESRLERINNLFVFRRQEKFIALPIFELFVDDTFGEVDVRRNGTTFELSGSVIGSAQDNAEHAVFARK